MFSSSLRRKFRLGLIVIVLASITTILVTALFEPKNDCTLQRVYSLEAVIDIGRGGLLDNGVYLVSDCYMVVYRIIPIYPEQLADYYQSGYHGLVTVLSRQNQQILAPSRSALVRYRLFANCQEAVAAAGAFTAFLTENGFYTFESRLLTDNRSCPRPEG